MGMNKIKFSQIGHCLPCMYLNHTNVYVSSDFADGFSDYFRGFLSVPSSNRDNRNYSVAPGTVRLCWRKSVNPGSRDGSGQEKN